MLIWLYQSKVIQEKHLGVSSSPLLVKFSCYQVQLLKAFSKYTQKVILEGICMCLYKAIVQSMFKHVASENGPFVLILQSYSQIFIVLKHNDQNLVELIWTTKNCII